MSAGKYLLGTAALVGGVYYYDQHVQPILPRKQHEELAHQTKNLEKSANDINNKLTQKIEDGKNFVIKQSDAVTQQVKDSSIYKDAKKTTEEYKDAVDYATDFDKTSARKAVQKYIDFINQLGEGKFETTTTPYSTMSPDVEVKEVSIYEKIFGTGKSDAEKLKDDARKKAENAKESVKDAKNGLFNWSTPKLEEADKQIEQAANDTANWANKQYNQAANEVNKQIDYASAEFNKYYAKTEKDWNKAVDDLNKQWEDTKKQVSGRYDTEKDRAIKNVQDAKTNFEKISNDVVYDPYKNQKLHEAKEHFKKSVDSLKLFGDDVYNDFSKKFQELFNQK